MDLIDRQAAIVDAKSWIAVNSFEQNLQNQVIEWLKEFPSAQPAELETLIKALEQEHKKLLEMQKAQHEQRWIQCSEKLPEGFMPYYATCKSKIDNRENWVIEGMYAPYFGWEEPPMVMCGDAEIIAWMPKELPEPWKGDAE